MKLHDKKELINKMVNYRFKDCWGTKTMLDYLMNNPNGPKYKERVAYEIVKEVDKYMVELSRNHRIRALENNITDMESIYDPLTGLFFIYIYIKQNGEESWDTLLFRI